MQHRPWAQASDRGIKFAACGLTVDLENHVAGPQASLLCAASGMNVDDDRRLVELLHRIKTWISKADVGLDHAKPYAGEKMVPGNFIQSADIALEKSLQIGVAEHFGVLANGLRVIKEFA